MAQQESLAVQQLIGSFINIFEVKFTLSIVTFLIFKESRFKIADLVEILFVVIYLILRVQNSGLYLFLNGHVKPAIESLLAKFLLVVIQALDVLENIGVGIH